MPSKNRRQFIKQSLEATAAAGLTALTATGATAQSNNNVAGANDRLRVGLIGCGGQGRGDLRQMLKIKNVECVALCDVDDEQSARAQKMVESDYSQHPQLVTRDFRRVLDLHDLDAVIVGTPDHWHALPTIMACQASKDVYVEKPLAISIGEGRAMVNAARQHNRIVQMGTQ
ncbi:MAG TPA: Gfo/Idh/MocA family oxidoreductase [Blastocatellia bacterium]